MYAPITSRRARRTVTVLLVALVAALLLVPLGIAQADTGHPPAPGSGTVKNTDGTLKFGMGPANIVPAKQVVDGRAYLVYSADPGATIRDRVALFNYDTKPLTLQVYATDAVQSADGAFGLLPGNAPPADAGSWITMHVPKGGKVVIPGRTTKAYGIRYVTFDVHVPRTATPGDHVGGVVASLKSTSKNTKGAKVTLDQRIGVRAYFSLTGTLTPDVSVEDLHASYTHQWDPLGRGLYTVTYFVHNKGNLRLNVTQDVSIDRCIIRHLLCPASSLVAHPAKLQDLLPGSRLQVTQVFDKRFGLGRLKATVTLHPVAVDPSYTKAIPDVSASTGFWALPWLLIIIIVLVLLALAGGGWRYERHRRIVARERALAAAAPKPKHAAPDDAAPTASWFTTMLNKLRRSQG